MQSLQLLTKPTQIKMAAVNTMATKSEHVIIAFLNMLV